MLGPDNRGKGAVFAAGLEWAITSGASVVNLSLSSRSEDYHALLHDIVEDAYFANVLFVCAANNVRGPSYPSLFSSVVSVAAHDVAGPGRVVLQPAAARGVRCPWGGRRGRLARRRPPECDRNSFAAPHIAAYAARIRAAHPGIAPFETKASSPERRPTHAEPTHGRPDEPIESKTRSIRSGSPRARVASATEASAVLLVGESFGSRFVSPSAIGRAVHDMPSTSSSSEMLPTTLGLATPVTPITPVTPVTPLTPRHPGHRGRHQAMPSTSSSSTTPWLRLSPPPRWPARCSSVPMSAARFRLGETAAILRINASGLDAADHAAGVNRPTGAGPESARGRHGDALDRQKGSLDRERPLAAAPRIAAVHPGCRRPRHHAMARHEQPDRVTADGSADRPRRAR